MVVQVEKYGIRTIAYILGLALALRLLVAIAVQSLGCQENFYAADTSVYLNPAKELLLTGRYTSFGLPEIVRPPGYSLLLIPGILLGHVEWITIILQIVLSCLTVYIVFKTAQCLFNGPMPATIAAVFYAVEPLSILYATKLLTETLFTCLTTVSLYYLVISIKRPSLKPLLVAACALSASVYVRAIGYYLPPLTACLLFLWISSKKRERKPWFLRVVVFLAVSMGLVGLWQVRNSVRAGYSGFSAISSVNLYFYAGAALLAAQEDVPYYEMQNRMGYRNSEIYFQNHPKQRLWSAAERYRYMRKEGIRILSNHIGAYAAIHLKGMLRTLLDPGAVDYLKVFGLYPESSGLLGTIVDRGLLRTIVRLSKERPRIFWSNLFMALLMGVYYLLGGIALSSRFSRSISTSLWFATGVYFVTLSGGPQALNRFRHPVMPILSLFAGYGLSLVLKKVHALRQCHCL